MNNQPISPNFLERIAKVKQQLARLSNLVSYNQHFDNLCVKHLLEKEPYSSDSSDEFRYPLQNAASPTGIIQYTRHQQNQESIHERRNLLTLNQEDSNPSDTISESLNLINFESSQSINLGNNTNQESSSQSHHTVTKATGHIQPKHQQKTIFFRAHNPEPDLASGSKQSRNQLCSANSIRKPVSTKVNMENPLKNLFIQNVSINPLIVTTSPKHNSKVFLSGGKHITVFNNNSSTAHSCSATTITHLSPNKSLPLQNRGAKPNRSQSNNKKSSHNSGNYSQVRSTKRLNSPANFYCEPQTKTSGIKTKQSKAKRNSNSNIEGVMPGNASNGFQELIVNSRNPKLNKITVNKFKQSMLKKGNYNGGESKASIGRQKVVLDQKFHLNLSQHKPLMQRIIEKKGFLNQYAAETRKYEEIAKQCLGGLKDQFAQKLYPLRHEMVAMLVNFSAQFSKKIDKKLIAGELGNFEPDYLSLLPDLAKVLSSLPNKLFKKNVVSEARYQEFSLRYRQLWAAFKEEYIERISNFGLFQLLEALNRYLNFLISNQLIESTQRKNLYTHRNIIQYYSHRSEKDQLHKGKQRKVVANSPQLVPSVKYKQDWDHQKAASNNKSTKKRFKDYDTERLPIEDQESFNHKKRPIKGDADELLGRPYIIQQKVATTLNTKKDFHERQQQNFLKKKVAVDSSSKELAASTSNTKNSASMNNLMRNNNNWCSKNANSSVTLEESAGARIQQLSTRSGKGFVPEKEILKKTKLVKATAGQFQGEGDYI